MPHPPTSPPASPPERGDGAARGGSSDGALSSPCSSPVQTSPGRSPGHSSGGGSPPRAPPAAGRDYAALRGGLRVVAAADVAVEALADSYATIQATNKNFHAFGITGELLSSYARLHAREAARWPWNAAVVDEHGSVAGFYSLLPSAEIAAGEELPPAALAHWRIFARLRSDVLSRPHSSPERGNMLVCTWMGFLPEYQGKGLAKQLMERCQDAAMDVGYTRWWTYSLNPNTTKAVGKVDRRVQLMSKAADYLFRLPCWVQNRVLMPIMYATGTVPRDFVMFSVPIATYPQMAALGLPNFVVANQPLRGSRYRSKGAVAAGARKEGGTRGSRGGALQQVLLALIVCVQVWLMPCAALASTAARIYRDMDWGGFAADVAHPTAPLYMTVLYFVMMKSVRPVSKEFRENKMRPFLKAYNAAMSLFSLVCCIVMATAMIEVWPLYGDDCSAAFRNPKYSGVLWVFYVSKFVEYIDSWALHAAGKHVSWLQFIHHTGAPWMMWLGARYGSEGGWMVVLFNSFVHFIMYAYYYGTMCGYRPRAKPLITVMQITQFITAMAFAWPYMNLPCMQAPHNAGKMLALVFTWTYVAAVLTLFLNFSLRNYLLKSRGN